MPKSRDLTKLQRRRQQERQKAMGLKSKTSTLHVHHAFLPTFLYRPCTSTTWNNHVLSLLGNGNGKGINSSISVWTRARSPLFSSNAKYLLLRNWAPRANREEKWKDAKSIYQRRFHGRCRCRIVRSTVWCTCNVVVLVIKPIIYCLALLLPSCPRILESLLSSSWSSCKPVWPS